MGIIAAIAFLTQTNKISLIRTEKFLRLKKKLVRFILLKEFHNIKLMYLLILYTYEKIPNIRKMLKKEKKI